MTDLASSVHRSAGTDARRRSQVPMAISGANRRKRNRSPVGAEEARPLHSFMREKQATAAPLVADIANQLVKAGAKIVYLTGRDVPRMQVGTLLNLKRNFFPIDSANAQLMMKPDPKMDDLLFKKQAFEEIKKMGVVVGVFENEPNGLARFHGEFGDVEIEAGERAEWHHGASAPPE